MGEERSDLAEEKGKRLSLMFSFNIILDDDHFLHFLVLWLNMAQECVTPTDRSRGRWVDGERRREG